MSEDTEFIRPPERIEIDPELKAFMSRALRIILNENYYDSFFQDEHNSLIEQRFDEDEEKKTDIHRQKIKDLLPSFYARTYSSPEGKRQTGEMFFPHERPALKYGWEKARVWRTFGTEETLKGKEINYWLAVDFSLASLFSVDNIKRSGFAKNQEAAVDLHREIKAFFEAKTGTTDMPTTIVVKIDPLNERKIDFKKVSDFGDFTDEVPDPIKGKAQRFYFDKTTKRIGEAELVEYASNKFLNARNVVRAHHGWTGSRDVMANKDVICSALDTLDSFNSIAILQAGMGAEKTAGWKINDRGKITAFDYAKQICVFADLTGLWFDYQMFHMHSMGGAAAYHLQDIISKRFTPLKARVNKEITPKIAPLEDETAQIQAELKQLYKDSKGNKDLIKRRLARLINIKKLIYDIRSSYFIPGFAFLTEAPAFAEANKFLKGIPGLVIGTGMAIGPDKLETHLPQKEQKAIRFVLKRVPLLMKGASLLEREVILDKLLDFLLPYSSDKIKKIHKSNYLADKKTAAAQAKGLLDDVDLVFTAKFPTLATTAEEDNLVDDVIVNSLLRDDYDRKTTNILPVSFKVGTGVDHYASFAEDFALCATYFAFITSQLSKEYRFGDWRGLIADFHYLTKEMKKKERIFNSDELVKLLRTGTKIIGKYT